MCFAAKYAPGGCNADFLQYVMKNNNKGEHEMLKKILIAAALIGTLGLTLHAQETQADAEKYAIQATQYYQRGSYAKALEYHNKALVILLKVKGENHPDTATCYNNIGKVYRQQGNYNKALEFYNKALAIELKVKGENHPDTAASHYNIGLVYGMQGNYAKALEFFNKALAIRLKVLGENHPDIVASHCGIAGTLYRSGKKTEARDHLRKAAVIARKTLGPDHPTTKQISAVLQFVENELSK